MLVVAAALAGAARAESPDAVVRRVLHVEQFELARVDLNGDGRAELIVYMDDQSECGSGGCRLEVLSPTRRGWSKVAHVTIARPPITVLPTRSHGWRDLTVFVAGGGILPGYSARLRFDGLRYPLNPSVPPAERYDGPEGKVLIAADPRPRDC